MLSPVAGLNDSSWAMAVAASTFGDITRYLLRGRPWREVVCPMRSPYR